MPGPLAGLQGHGKPTFLETPPPKAKAKEEAEKTPPKPKHVIQLKKLTRVASFREGASYLDSMDLESLYLGTVKFHVISLVLALGFFFTVKLSKDEDTDVFTQRLLSLQYSHVRSCLFTYYPP